MVLVITPMDIVATFLFILIAGIYIFYQVITAYHQSKCSHDLVTETQACDAICSLCGKNLGFIGKWREKHAKK